MAVTMKSCHSLNVPSPYHDVCINMKNVAEAGLRLLQAQQRSDDPALINQ